MLKILGRRTSINVRKALWTADELGADSVIASLADLARVLVA